MGNLLSMHGIKQTYKVEKEDFAQLIAAALANIISQLVGQSVAGALAIAGGAAGIFRSLKDPHVIVRDSPLYWLVDGASILNYPPEGDPDARVGANGSQKPDRTQVLFAWTAARMQALWRWVYTNGATFAGALYAVFNALPLVQVGCGTVQSSKLLGPSLSFGSEAFPIHPVLASYHEITHEHHNTQALAGPSGDRGGLATHRADLDPSNCSGNWCNT